MKKLRITVDGKVYDVTVQVLEDDEATLTGAGFVGSLPPDALGPRGAPAPGSARLPPPVPAGQADVLLAPLAGTVRKVFVEAGAAVEAQAPIVMLDAMKMDTYIYAPRAARVTDVAVKAGDSVQVGDLLVRFTARD